MHLFSTNVLCGFRRAFRRPVHTLAVVATLALGIGVTTLVFSVVNAVLLRPLAFPDGERMVVVWSQESPEDAAWMLSSYPDFRDLREEGDVFDALTLIGHWKPTWTGAQEPRKLSAARASADVFGVLGVGPVLGRGFTDVRDDAHTVVLSHGFWQRELGGDPQAIGRVLDLDGTPHEVVGVLPAGIESLPPLTFESAQMWAPLRDKDRTQGRGNRFYRVAGRLSEGVPLETARRALDVFGAGLAAAHPETNRGVAFKAESLRELLVGSSRQALLVLLGAVLFVLLIAAGNVANLALAQASTRREEMATRAALGARRHQLVTQLVAESLPLIGLGVLAGGLLAMWGLESLDSRLPVEVEHLGDLVFDGRVALFLGILVGLVTMVASLLPALQMTRKSSLAGAWARSSTPDVSRNRLRTGLLVTELALSLVLLVGAGLMIKSFYNISRVDYGFEGRGVLTVDLALDPARYGEPRRFESFSQTLLDHVRRLPTVQHAAHINHLPLSGGNMQTTVRVLGRAQRAERDLPYVGLRGVSDEYFRTLDIDLKRGRPLEKGDCRNGGRRLAVVNETAAKQLWKGDDPLGRQLILGDNPEPWQVVGIAEDVRHEGARSATLPEVYVPFERLPHRALSLVVRTLQDDPLALAADVRERVRRADPSLPIETLRTLEDRIAEDVRQPRSYAMLLLGFAGLALFLALVGIYGLVTYLVGRRRREIGIRMALGARRRDVVLGILRDGVAWSIRGLLLGLVGVWILTRFLEGLLYEVQALDPVIMATLVGLQLAVTLGAALPPALRAVGVDPARTLRQD